MNLRRATRRAARRYGVPEGVLVAQLGAESNYDPNAVSPAGARGVAQFIESTAKAYGVNLHDGNPLDDIDGAARYMRDNLKRTGGNVKEALSIYNSGRPDGYKNIAETRNYVSKILGAAGSSGGGGTGGGGGSSSIALPGGMDLKRGSTSLQVTDPDLVHKQAFAQWFAQRNPTSPLVKFGVVDPNMSTTSTLKLPNVTGFSMTPGGRRAVGGGGGGGNATSPDTGASLQQIVAKADRIDSKHLPYAWGGGHGGKVTEGTPVDCSGAVSEVLGVDPRVSGEFTKWGKGGRGKNVTIYANGEHVLMEINGHFWGTSNSNPGGGAGWIPRTAISKAYLSRFTARHPAGM